MIIIPANTPHTFTEITTDRIVYMVVRVDPKKVLHADKGRQPGDRAQLVELRVERSNACRTASRASSQASGHVPQAVSHPDRKSGSTSSTGRPACAGPAAVGRNS